MYKEADLCTGYSLLKQYTFLLCIVYQGNLTEGVSSSGLGQSELTGWRLVYLPIPRNIDDTEEQNPMTNVYLLSINENYYTPFLVFTV